ncbi:MAG: NAD(P)/FAD-dependent oxidoreductase [Clostridiales bacterium]|nr:NAD(P)/FAD-dependent oxidoreductase [Clostridiales bacterium]
MKKIVVVGGGPAGMMAAIAAAEAGGEAVLLEKNEVLGRKLALTGKGRCNLANASDIPEVIKNIPGNGVFLHSALRRFSPGDLTAFFSGLGVPLKVERGKRVFPVSDDAHDVVSALKKRLKTLGAEVRCGTRAEGLVIEEGRVVGVRAGGEKLPVHAVIVATGGLSYPATGSTGDGYRMAEEAGHSIIPPAPSLVGLDTEEEWVSPLAGLTLKNVAASLFLGDKLLGREFGELLFTHTGVSGPVILTLSRALCRFDFQARPLPKLLIDLKPALSPEQLAARIQRDLQSFSRKRFENSLDGLLPQSLIPVIVGLSGVDPHKQANQVNREERARLAELLRGLPLTVRGTRPIAEAIVTAGGVNVKEIDPKTMESRLVKGLFFCGELLDVDGLTGGFNLQAAFSTGHVAGREAAK